MIKEKINNQLQKVLSEMGIPFEEISLDIPGDSSHGDYTTNVALRLSKQLKKSPLEIAEEIVKKLEVKSENLKILEKIEAVTPGFINFYLSKEYLLNEMDTFVKDPESVFIKAPEKKFEMYENTQPNTNKPLHVGHLRNMSLATAIVNLRKTLGYKVWSVNINNDRGIHIIKAMWAYLIFGKEKFETMKEAHGFEIGESTKNFKFQISNFKSGLEEWGTNRDQWQTPTSHNTKPDHFVGMFYMLGDRAEKKFPEIAIPQMKEMLLVWEAGDENIRALWERMNNWFYEGFKETHARVLGIKTTDPQFDHEWYESEVYDDGKKIVMENLDKGLFYKRPDGAIVAKLDAYALPEKVVIRSDGSSLYMTQDIALERQRIQEYKADLVAIIIANEQDLYFKQVFAIQDALGVAPLTSFFCFTYGMVNLKGGLKMSSREGNVITVDDLLDLVKEKIKTSFQNDDEIAEQITLGAIKYAMLKQNPKGNMEFDVDESISLDGNSGPYIQYAYTRTQSLLRKAKENFKFQISNFKLNNEELELLRLLHQFSQVVNKSALQYAPHTLCEYLFIVAKSFNLFYQKHRIIDADTEQEKSFRLGLTQATGMVLARGLGLLGIAAPKKM